jgi:hypothetical protein
MIPNIQFIEYQANQLLHYCEALKQQILVFIRRVKNMRFEFLRRLKWERKQRSRKPTQCKDYNRGEA